jgi:hypothetical protein
VKISFLFKVRQMLDVSREARVIWRQRLGGRLKAPWSIFGLRVAGALETKIQGEKEK